ncbi:MAG: TonB-dependent receptor, partial [Bacteroidia bacterium]|nr:TonB-dependent receptor [Bacteroidia bacterium]
ISVNGQLQRFEPGTARFDSAFNAITSTLFTEGGSRFYDKSSLYHIQGEYKFTPRVMDITLGGNFRMYKPDSKGTIFQDTGDVLIRNREFGVYTGIEKKFIVKDSTDIYKSYFHGMLIGGVLSTALFIADKNTKPEMLALAAFLPTIFGILNGIPGKEKNIKLNLTNRVDKNENYDYLFSPAISAVYSFNQKQVMRASFSSAIRNPTLADQYLYYRVTPLVLLVGNLSGFDSLVTLPSLLTAFNLPSPLNQDTLEYFNVRPIQPESVKTIEAGYRATLFKSIYVDLAAYYSWYRNFIGYKIGASVDYVPQSNLFNVHHIYRVAANANDEVTTRGVAIGLNYYFRKFFMLNVNYSYNVLDRKGSTDPLIPAYNTPKNKYNIGFGGRDIDVTLFNKVHLHNFGFGINYKWVEGFEFEGSPQFTGYVPTYDFWDAQINYHARKIFTTFKAGASNLLDNRKFTVYGGPYSGRIAYVSILFELSHDK